MASALLLFKGLFVGKTAPKTLSENCFSFPLNIFNLFLKFKNGRKLASLQSVSLPFLLYFY